MPGIDEVPYLTNSRSWTSISCRSICSIVGGSYIGLEFAQMYRRFGSRVTIVEMGAAPDRPRGRGRLAGGQGDSRGRRHRGATRAPSASAAAGRQGHRASASDCKERDAAVRGTHLLLAVGRVPNTDDLGLDARRHRRSTSAATSRSTSALRTSNPNVWALGDCNGKGAFTHTAYNDYEIVADNLLCQRRPQVDRPHPRRTHCTPIRRSAASA